MKKVIFFLSIICFTANAQQKTEAETASIAKTLNAWHKAAAEAKFDTYFSMMTSDGVFVGTDATENWQYEAFKTFSKPYFDKGKAWNFTALQRNIYINETGDFAWFDELLNTQMKICRGSGVLKKQNGQWKIAHYVLSMTIPNDNSDEVVKIKAAFDDELTKKLQSK